MGVLSTIGGLIKTATPINLEAIAGAFAAGALFASATTIYVEHKFSLAAQTVQAKAQVKEVTTQAEAKINADDKADQHLDHYADRAASVIKKIYVEVPKYVPSNPECDLTVDAVRMLNDARRLSDPAFLKSTRGKASEEGGTPAAVPGDSEAQPAG